MSSSNNADQIPTSDFIQSVLRAFRELVVNIEDENNQLKSKIRDLSTRAKTLSYKTRQHQQSSTSSSLETNNSSSTTDLPSRYSAATTNTSSATLPSSSTNNTSSTKPPPYKSVVRIAPLPPARTRRKSSYTLSAVDALLNRSHTTRRVMAGSRGALIVLEGLDRVGKSTLAKKLVDHFRRIDSPVAYCRFPERETPIGKLIDTLLKDNSRKVDDHVLHLLFSANRWEFSSKIRDTILAGTTMVVDRYSYSGIAYSSAKSALPIGWCSETEKGLPKPDLVIYLELPTEAQIGRAGYGEERFETTEFQESARRQYQHVMNISQETWLKIDVEDKSADQILGEVIVPVKKCLDSCANKELGYLDFL